MKHGVAFRKLSRPTAHRMLMLRNLVTSLLRHEQIKTTLPKAREAARLAEKLITRGKTHTRPSVQRAEAFLLDRTLIPKLFGPLAERYRDRPGGYTRIHKYGNREGDNAPHAILELVDSPRDLRFEMTARAVGWETLSRRLRQNVPVAGSSSCKETIERTLLSHAPTGPPQRSKLSPEAPRGLRALTQRQLHKSLKYRSEADIEEFVRKADDHMRNLLAEPLAFRAGLARVMAVETEEIETKAKTQKDTFAEEKSANAAKDKKDKDDEKDGKHKSPLPAKLLAGRRSIDATSPVSPLRAAKGSFVPPKTFVPRWHKAHLGIEKSLEPLRP